MTASSRHSGLALATMLILLLSTAAPSQAQTSEGNPEAARALALRVCANCHFVSNEQRQPPMDSAPSFDALARDFTMNEAHLRGFLNRPHPPMPDPQLSRQEIDDIVCYILLLRRRSIR